MKNKNELRKEIFALDVASLANYVDNKGDVIANLISSAPTLASLMPMTGAKANTQVQLNILSTSVVWDSGDCVNTATGGATPINPRLIDMVRLTDREELCLDKLDAKLPMIMAPGARNEELPFANMYIDLKVKENAKQLEKLVWQGNVSTGVGNMALTDGYLAIADSELVDLAFNDTFVTFDASTTISVVQTVLANRTDEMYDMDDFKIYMSQAYASILAGALITAHGIAGTGNFVNTGDENQKGGMRFMYPGTNVEIVGTPGLAGSDAIFATNDSNLRYATDLENDKEDVQLFFDQYHKALVSDLVFTIGFQYEFPENVIYLTKA